MSLGYYFDIGNSRGKAWRCRGEAIEAFWVQSHHGEVSQFIASLPSSFDDDPDAVYCASVLGASANEQICSAVKRRWAQQVRFAKVLASFKGVINAYFEPERLGVDRWLALLAAAKRSDSACVVSCGTAVTLDVLKSRTHVGGYIVPGLELMVDVAQRRMAGVTVERATSMDQGIAYGHSTSEAVTHGAVRSIVALVEHVAASEPDARVFLTGGDALLVSEHLKCSHVVEPLLVLHGMREMFGD